MSRFVDLAGLVICVSFFAGGITFAEVDFRTEVRPILSDKCFACHGFDEEAREADLRLDTREGALMDLGGYVAIEPGNAEDSEVFIRLISEDKTEVMPPRKAHKTMSKEEIEVIRKWIEEGAEYAEHWSYEKLERPEVPKGFAGNEIDGFIGVRLKAKGMEPSEKADRVTLLRRLSWDLRGVPPTLEEKAAFLADESPAAWEKLVDRYLADSKYGERMAVWWLDLVRYADTAGYHSDKAIEISGYRDYVIQSFNENKSYDQFAIEQLAGDLLPEATLEQRVGSGYNRLLKTTDEGGAQAKEYLTIYAADRVRSVSEVWLGSTLGCAECHDHKYDPFSSKDFYSMAAFFADIKEGVVAPRKPNLMLPTVEQKARMAELEGLLKEHSIERLLARDAELQAALSRGQRLWEKQAGEAQQQWDFPKVEKTEAPEGTVLKAQGDGSLLATGKVPDRGVYSAVVGGKGKVTAVRVEAYSDESFGTKGGWSRGNGNFVLTGVEVLIGGKAVKIAKAFADYEQSGYPAAGSIDGKKTTGWAVSGHDAKKRDGSTRRIVFQFAEPLELGEGGELKVTLSHESQHTRHNIDRFRIGVTGEVAPSVDDVESLPPAVLAALKKEKRSGDETKSLRGHYFSIAPELAEARKKLKGYEDELAKVNKGQRTMLVAEALEKPRMTRILARGNWMDDSGEEVQPAVPEFLPQEKIEGRRATRLDLAQWIVADENPLTARAAMNRVWRLYFGRGIAANVLDLGGQGNPPTQPELLDWMAASFRDGGWDVKAMVKVMVMSETYQQVSTSDSILREKDPTNGLYARQGRWRMDAEFVRDTALQLSGLLKNRESGGPSVKPYQPAGYWQHLNFPKRKWEADMGDDLYRRSLYTFWCRTFLHPSMLAFDAPSREECTAERARSNIPQQALVLLNDPIFVEAARVFGERIQAQEGSVREKISWGLEQALTRAPESAEVDLLEKLYERQRARYADDAEAAKELLAVGATPVREGVPVEELAAWAQVGRVILNTYETISRY